MLVATVGIAAAVAMIPHVDLAVSRLFWRQGQGFFLRKAPVLVAVYRSVPVLTWAIALLLVAAHLHHWRTGRPLRGLNQAVTWYLTVALLVGPLLLTNVMLKPIWGRVRPFEVAEFGGATPFTPAFEVATRYGGHSFPSGHAAMGFFLLAFCEPIRDPCRRHRFRRLAWGAGLVVGLCRVAQGGHFLSDVLVTGLIIYAATRGLHTMSDLAGKPVWYDEHRPLGGLAPARPG